MNIQRWKQPIGMPSIMEVNPSGKYIRYKDYLSDITALRQQLALKELENNNLRDLLERALDDSVEVLETQFHLLPYKQTRYDNQHEFVMEIREALLTTPTTEHLDAFRDEILRGRIKNGY